MRRFPPIAILKRPSTGMAVGVLALTACIAAPLEKPVPKADVTTKLRIAQNVKNKVDVLFMIDSSASMGPMSDQLKAKFNEFFKVFDELASKNQYVDLQIGVVTSDYGAGASGAPGCQPSPGGQQGRLVDRGAYAAPDCKAPLGSRFIKYAFAKDGKGGNNLPPGQDLIQTFTCMATVVTTQAAGCGFEHQLESVYAALHNNLPENQGFLREGALLAVVFVTNEDDCSAPIDSDLFDKNKVAQYGFLSSYRCNRFGQVCTNAQTLPPYGDSMGAMAGCQAAPNPGGAGPGKLYDISRYVNFFKNPASQGGVKTNPLDVVLFGVMPPADPVQVILSNPGTPGNQPYAQCGQLNEQSNPPCVPVIQHSCQNVARPEFFGDPPVRLQSVINSVANRANSSICDQDYTGALNSLGKLIVTSLGGGCIASKLPDGKPDCIVQDETRNIDGSTTVTKIPACEDAGNTFPCWRIEKKMGCETVSPQGFGLTVDRNNQPAPDNTDAIVYCQVLPG